MNNLDELEQILRHRFARRELLEQALTHSSFANENNLGPMEDNERLEFLGDAILGFLVSEALCEARPNLSEGQLSKLKGFLVSSANLVQCAEQIRLVTTCVWVREKKRPGAGEAGVVGERL